MATVGKIRDFFSTPENKVSVKEMKEFKDSFKSDEWEKFKEQFDAQVVTK